MNASELQNLEAIVRAAVTRVLAERTSQLPIPNSQSETSPIAKLLVGVCCGECVNEQAQNVLTELKRENFSLFQPEESAFKTRSEREKLIAEADGVLLPSVGDDDAAKMAMGIFDEPVARLALTALAIGKPVFAAVHSPYENALKKSAPALSRVWGGHRKLLQSYGIEIVEYSSLGQAIQNRFMSQTSTQVKAGNGKRVLISVREIEAAAKNGASLKLPPNAIITPLARDRAKELNVKIN